MLLKLYLIIHAFKHKQILLTMGQTGIIIFSISIFVILTILYWLVTRGYGEKVYGKKMWQSWTTKTFYWQGALFVSGTATVIIILALKCGNIIHA